MKLIVIVFVIVLLVQQRDCQILHDLLRNILTKSASTSAASSAASSRASYQGSVDGSKPRPPPRPVITTTTDNPFNFLFKSFIDKSGSKVPANKPFNVPPPPPPSPFQQKGPTRLSLPVAQPMPPLSTNCGGTLAIPFFPCGNIPPQQPASTPATSTPAPPPTQPPPSQPPQPQGPPFGPYPFGQYPNPFFGGYPPNAPPFGQYPYPAQQPQSPPVSPPPPPTEPPTTAAPPPPPPPTTTAPPSNPPPPIPEAPAAPPPVPPKPEKCDENGPPFYCYDFIPQRDNSLYEPQGYQFAPYQDFGGRGYDQGLTYYRNSQPYNGYSGYSYSNYH